MANFLTFYRQPRESAAISGCESSIQFFEPVFLCTAFVADGKVTEKYTKSEVGHDESWPENPRPTVEKNLCKVQCEHTLKNQFKIRFKTQDNMSIRDVI